MTALNSDPRPSADACAVRLYRRSPALCAGSHTNDTLVVLVPGLAMRAGDFEEQGLIEAVGRRHLQIAVGGVDLGLNAYLDGSVEDRMLSGITQLLHAVGADRTWLVGFSMGCQAILRCARARPGLIAGLVLITPYMGNAGLIAAIERSGGLRRWSASGAAQTPYAELLAWLAATPPAGLPRIVLGRALADRFVATANLLAELLPSNEVIDVPGEHDWPSWRRLWDLVVDANPFGADACSTRCEEPRARC